MQSAYFGRFLQLRFCDALSISMADEEAYAFVFRADITSTKGNTVAMQHAKPVVTVRCGGDFAEPGSHENDESRHAKTTSLNKKNKKPCKEKGMFWQANSKRRKMVGLQVY